jgi:glycosyltransferase involved in cell wall biosynthesis
VIGASSYLAEAARELGARDVRVIPNGVEIPEEVGEPDDPPHVLFVGRLSEEKGILDFLEATEGLPRVIVGDGPLRDRVSEAVGFIPHDRIGQYYERAAVVCVPSRREGYGMVAREALAHGRPVVATRVGGLADAVADGVTGRLVTVGDSRALRGTVRSLLEDGRARESIRAAAREQALQSLTWAGYVDAIRRVYGAEAGE